MVKWSLLFQKFCVAFKQVLESRLKDFIINFLLNYFNNVYRSCEQACCSGNNCNLLSVNKIRKANTSFNSTQSPETSSAPITSEFLGNIIGVRIAVKFLISKKIKT